MSNYRSQIDRAYDKKVLGVLDQVTRKVALGLQADLTENTPVRTGRARSNWLPSFSAPRNSSSESTGGSPMINFSGYALGDKIFLANNLPYIGRLNAGSSKQAPAGFVDDAILRAKRSAKEVLRGINAKL